MDLKLSERAYLGAKAVEEMEGQLEAAVSLLEAVLKSYPNLHISHRIRTLIKAHRGES